MTLKDRLKKKRLVYLYSDITCVDIKSGTRWSSRNWIIDVDPNYPWACGGTSKKEDASAFTVSLAKAINRSMEKSKMGGYGSEPAPKEHDGTIYYLPQELKKRKKA